MPHLGLHHHFRKHRNAIEDRPLPLECTKPQQVIVFFNTLRGGAKRQIPITDMEEDHTTAPSSSAPSRSSIMNSPTVYDLSSIAKAKGFQVLDVPGDGNCQLASVATQIPGFHKSLKQMRKEIASWLHDHQDYQWNEIPLSALLDTSRYSSFEDYCLRFQEDAVWGDLLSLIAASELYNLRIYVLPTYDSSKASSIIPQENNNDWIVIAPNHVDKSTKNIFLGWIAGYHFTALTPQADRPTPLQ